MDSREVNLSQLSDVFRVQLRKQSLNNEIRKKRRELFRENRIMPENSCVREFIDNICARVADVLESPHYCARDKAVRISETLHDLIEVSDRIDEDSARYIFKTIKRVLQCVYKNESAVLSESEIDLALRVFDLTFALSSLSFRRKSLNRKLLRILDFSEYVLSRENNLFILEKAIWITANLISDTSPDPLLDEKIQRCSNFFIDRYAPTFFNFFMAEALLFLMERIFLFRCALFRMVDGSKVIKALFQNLDKITSENHESILIALKAYLRIQANNKLSLNLSSLIQHVFSLQLCKRSVQKHIIEIICWTVERAPTIAKEFISTNTGSLACLVFDQCHSEDNARIAALLRLYESLLARRLLSWEDISGAVENLVRVFEQRISFDWQSSLKIVRFLSDQFETDSEIALVCFVEGMDTLVLEKVLKSIDCICSNGQLTEESKQLVESIFRFLNRIYSQIAAPNPHFGGVLAQLKGMGSEVNSAAELCRRILSLKATEIKHLQDQFSELIDEMSKGQSNFESNQLNWL